MSPLRHSSQLARLAFGLLAAGVSAHAQTIKVLWASSTPNAGTNPPALTTPNWNVITAANTTTNALIDSSGAATAVGVVTTNWSFTTNTAVAGFGNTAAGWADGATFVNGMFKTNGPGSGTVRFTGLAGAAYEVDVVAFTGAGGSFGGSITVGGAAANGSFSPGISSSSYVYNTSANAQNFLIWNSVAPVSGEIVVTFNLTGTIGEVNAIRITPAKTTPTITWAAPSAITYGTTLSSTQLNASTGTVAGAFTYNPVSGTVLATGNRTLTTSFVPTDTTTYNSATATNSLTVNPASLAVIAANASRTYSTSNPTFTASYSGFVNSETASVVSGTASFATSATLTSSPGTYTITPSAGTLAATNYTFGTFTTGTLTITKATGSITLGSLAQTYDGTAKSATATTTPSSLTVGLTYNGSATAPSAAGTYTVAATINDTNYQGTASGSLVIAKATPTLTWSTPTAITYGTTLSSTQLNASTGTIAGAFTYSPSASTVLGAGNRTLTVSFTPTDTSSYNTVTRTNSLTVNAASLAVIAANATRTYSTSNPTFTASYSGFVNSETSAVVTGTASFATSATLTSSPGTYTITPSAGTLAATNYTFGTFTTGALTITKATGSITLGSLAQTFDGNPKNATVTTTPSGLTVGLTYNGSATAPSAVGTYTVAATINDTNYQGTTTGSLAITALPVITSSLTASSTINTPFTYTISASGTPTSFSATGLPAGLSVNTTSGLISGTPTAAGTSSIGLGATNAAGTGTATLSLTIVGVPVITTHPVSQTVTAGTAVTFTVAATGSTPFSYQWLKDGVPITGATSASYTIASPQLADAANYTAVVSNSLGLAVSNVAVLGVNAGPAIASIVTQTGRVIEFGASTTLTAAATGSGTFTYQWFKNGTAISGATAASYPISVATAADAADYTVRITNSVGNVTSSTISVIVATVGSGTGPVTIATNTGTQVSGNIDSTTGILTGSVTTGGTAVAPRISGINTRGDLFVDLGSTATLAVTASGNPAPTYQWFKDFVVLPGQTASTLVIANAQAANAGKYNVLVTNSGGSVATDTLGVTVAQLGTRDGPITIATSGGTQVAGSVDSAGVLSGSVTVAASSSVAPQLDGISSKAGLLLNQGASATLSAAASGNPVPTYQWFKGATALPGQVRSSLSLTNVQTSDAGSYTVRASNLAGSAISSPMLVTVIQLNGSSGPVVVAGGNGTAVNGSIDSSGVLTGTVTSGGSVAPRIAGINNQTDLLVKTGASATFTATATGSPAPSYQWLKNGAPISGATAASYTIASASAADAGSYAVTATNSAGSATSSAIGVTVALVPTGSGTLSIATSGGTQVAGNVDSSGLLNGSVTANAASGPVAPTINAISSAAGLLVNQGSSATLAASASGNPAPSYQWFKNGTTLPGQTGSTLTLTNAQTSDAGTYTVRATNASGAVTSAGTVVTVIQIGSGTGPITIAGGNGTTVNGNVDSSGGLTGSATSGTPGAVVAPKIAGVTSKADLLVGLGESATLTAFATGTPAPTYQWFRNGVALRGQTAATLTLTNAAATDSGSYTVRATNSAGSVTSSSLGVNVAQLGSGTGPVSIATSGGTQVAATVDASGSLSGTLTVNAADIATAPRISALSSTPGSLLLQRGSSTTLTAAAVGNPAPTYQWFKNDAPISGATASTYTIASAAATDAGIYTVRATNSTGSSTSSSLAVTVGNIGTDNQVDISTSGGTVITATVDPATGVLSGGLNTGGPGFALAPRISAITSNPASIAAEVGSTAVLGAVVTGNPAPTYQWLRNGVALTGQTAATLTLANIQPAAAGVYTVRATNSAGVVTSNTVAVTVYSTGANGQLAATTSTGTSVSGAISPTTGAFAGTVTNGVLPPVVIASRLTNLSARTSLAAGRSITSGIIVTGTGRKQVLVRAVGPGLAQFGLTGVLPNPKVEIFRGSTLLASNSGVGQSGVVGEIAQASQRIGAFALAPSGTDAAILTNLDPGSYNVVVSSLTGLGGQILVELYDPNAEPSTTVRFANFSSNTPVASGDILFGGFAVAGNTTKRVLVRAVGPTLAANFGVTGTMPAPVLKISNGSTVLAENRGWGTSADAAQLAASALSVGAFALRAGSTDSAALLTLPPGSYNVQITDATGAPGIVLFELYEIP